MDEYLQQTNFSRGEVDPLVIDRQPDDFYASATQLMDNFFPDLSGAAYVRAPLRKLTGGETTIAPGASTIVDRVLRTMVYLGQEVLFVVDLVKTTGPTAYGVNIAAYLVGAASLTNLITTALPTLVPFPDPPPPLNTLLSSVQSGPATFFVSKYFYPIRFFFTAPGAMSAQRMQFWQLIYGTATPQPPPALAGKVFSPAPGDNHWTGSGTLWSSQLLAGDAIIWASDDGTIRQSLTVLVVTDNTHLTTTQNYAGPAGGQQGVFLKVQTPTNWVGNQSFFTSQLSVGATFRFNQKSYTVKTITDDTHFTSNEVYTDTPFESLVSTPYIFPTPSLPGLVTFYQNRLVLLARAGSTTSLDASTPNDPFTITGVTVAAQNAAAPINFTYGADGLDQFLWVVATNRIYTGSAQGEFVLGDANQVFSVSSAGLFRAGTSGGSAVPPFTTGDIMYFANQPGTQILSVRFDFYRQAFTADDLSFLAPHLLQAGVTQMSLRTATQGDRTSRAVFMDSARNIRTVAISPNQNVVAWSRITLGAAMSVWAVQASKQNVYVSVADNRAGSAQQLHILRLDPNGNTSLMFDALLDYADPGAGKILTLSGIHSWATQVAVFTTGTGTWALYPVSNTGTVDLTSVSGTLGVCSVGFPYQGRIGLLPVRIEDKNGLRLNRKRRVSRVILDVYNTPQVLLNGHPLLTPLGSPAGLIQAPYTGTVEDRPQQSWDTQDYTEIASNPGYPATVRSITRECA